VIQSHAKGIALLLDCSAVNINDVISNLMCTTRTGVGGGLTHYSSSLKALADPRCVAAVAKTGT
jgi:hypothetical protein